MAYPGASATAPNGADVDFSSLLPFKITLQQSQQQQQQQQERQVRALLRKVNMKKDCDAEEIASDLMHLLNHEIIIGGNSYPFTDEMSLEVFKSYYCSHDLFVLVVVEEEREEKEETEKKIKSEIFKDLLTVEGEGASKYLLPLQKSKIIGSVHVRPNFVGISASVANGAFLVNPFFRRLQAATVLGSCFPTFAKVLGYKSTLFNLVYEQNAASLKLWQKLCYPQVGRVEGAGMIKKDSKSNERIETAAIMFSVHLTAENVFAPSIQKKKDEIKIEEILKTIGSSQLGAFFQV